MGLSKSVSKVTKSVSKTVSSVSKAVSKAGSDVKNQTERVTRSFEDTWDTVNNIERSARSLASNAGDAVGSAAQGDFSQSFRDIKAGFHDVIDIYLSVFFEFGLTFVDDLLENVGVKGSTQYGKDMVTATRYLAHGMLDAEWQAWKMAIILAALIFVSWLLGGLDGGGMAMAMANTIIITFEITSYAAIVITVMATTVLAMAYVAYSITSPLAAIGRQIRHGGMNSVRMSAQSMERSMMMSTANSYIFGEMGEWMAGGSLYDSPRAGGVLLNPTGSQNTTRFLRMQDMNMNHYTDTYVQEKYYNPMKFTGVAAVEPGDDGWTYRNMVKTEEV